VGGSSSSRCVLGFKVKKINALGLSFEHSAILNVDSGFAYFIPIPSLPDQFLKNFSLLNLTTPITNPSKPSLSLYFFLPAPPLILKKETLNVIPLLNLCRVSSPHTPEIIASYLTRW
jgi:hypothetical protein